MSDYKRLREFTFIDLLSHIRRPNNEIHVTTMNSSIRLNIELIRRIIDYAYGGSKPRTFTSVVSHATSMLQQMNVNVPLKMLLHAYPKTFFLAKHFNGDKKINQKTRYKHVLQLKCVVYGKHHLPYLHESPAHDEDS